MESKIKSATVDHINISSKCKTNVAKFLDINVRDVNNDTEDNVALGCSCHGEKIDMQFYLNRNIVAEGGARFVCIQNFTTDLWAISFNKDDTSTREISPRWISKQLYRVQLNSNKSILSIPFNLTKIATEIDDTDSETENLEESEEEVQFEDLLTLNSTLYENDLFHDLVVKCSDGQERKAHKSVLAASSAVFEAMFRYTDTSTAVHMFHIADLYGLNMLHWEARRVFITPSFIDSLNFESLENPKILKYIVTDSKAGQCLQQLRFTCAVNISPGISVNGNSVVKKEELPAVCLGNMLWILTVVTKEVNYSLEIGVDMLCSKNLSTLTDDVWCVDVDIQAKMLSWTSNKEWPSKSPTLKFTNETNYRTTSNFQFPINSMYDSEYVTDKCICCSVNIAIK